jgi:hypothetical protein
MFPSEGTRKQKTDCGGRNGEKKQATGRRREPMQWSHPHSFGLAWLRLLNASEPAQLKRGCNIQAGVVSEVNGRLCTYPGDLMFDASCHLPRAKKAGLFRAISLT